MYHIDQIKKSIESHYPNLKYEDLKIIHNNTTIFDNSILNSVSKPEYFENSDIKDILKRSKIIEPKFSFRDNHEFSSRYSENKDHRELFNSQTLNSLFWWVTDKINQFHACFSLKLYL
jgi:hypothetical protein